MLDSDLAAIYGIEHDALKRAIANEIANAFLMTLHLSAYARGVYKLDSRKMRYQVRTAVGARPWVFTEHGALMLASVLNSEIAVQASVRVVRAFVRLREMVAANAQLAAKLARTRAAARFS